MDKQMNARSGAAAAYFKEREGTLLPKNECQSVRTHAHNRLLTTVQLARFD